MVVILGFDLDVNLPRATTNARSQSRRVETDKTKLANITDVTHSADRLYGGQPLSVWQQRMKDWDPVRPESLHAVTPLIEIIRQPDVPWFTRRQAALFLGAIGEPAHDVIPVLIELLQRTSESEMSSWAIKALALFGPDASDATPRLIEILRDTSQPMETRVAAVEALSRIGIDHPPALNVLIGLLKSDTFESSDAHQQRRLREAAADVLAMMGNSAGDAVPSLIQTTRDDHEPLRRKSVAALGAIGSPPDLIIPSLVERLVLDSSDAVRDSAGDALAKLRLAAMPALSHLLSDEDAEVRWRAAASIGKIGREAKQSAGALFKLASDDDAVVRITAIEAAWYVAGDADVIAAFAIQKLTNPDRQIRIRAFRLLSKMGSAASRGLPQLDELLNDDRSYVRTAAAKAIEAIKSDAKPRKPALLIECGGRVRRGR